MEDKGKLREQSLKKDKYFTANYFNFLQWEAFKFQIHKVYQLYTGGKCLEIGKGSGIVEAILREMGINMDSLDINSNLSPTYVGDISDTNLHLPHDYSLVLCAEVLEHLPFDCFDKCLKNIAALTNDIAILTLPNCMGGIRIFLGIHNRGKSFVLKCPWRRRIDKVHFWEINSADYCTKDNITKHLEQFFNIIECGDVREHPSHYFYVLKKK